MVFLKGVVKLLLFLVYNMAYMVEATAILLSTKEPLQRKRALINNISKWTGRALKLLGFTISVTGKEHIPTDGKALIVCNHLSYLDVFILAATYPTVFVTSYEVRDAFFLGYMCKLGATLFIDRRSRHGLTREIAEISTTINEGLPVAFFPEGTSSNGDDVLPFKASFMALAKAAEVPVTPVCLRYESINGEAITAKNRDRIYYYGDVPFFPQFPLLPFLQEVRVTLTYLPQLSSAEFDRKELSHKAWSMIRDCYTQ